MQIVLGKEVPWIYWDILCCQIYVDNANRDINKPNNPERKFNILIFIAATDSPSKKAKVAQSIEKIIKDIFLYLTCKMPKEAKSSTLASHRLLLNFIKNQ